MSFAKLCTATVFVYLVCSLGACSPARTAYGRGTPAPTAPPPAPTFNPATDSPITTGQPGYVGSPRVYPTSPHKRVLPASTEPGLWSGDRTRAAVEEMTPAVLFEVQLPFAPDASPDSEAITRNCAEGMDYAAARAATFHDIMAEDKSTIRRCIAALLYQHCAASYLDKYLRDAQAGIHFDRAEESRRREVKKTADEMVTAACAGKSVHPTVAPTASEWTKVMSGYPNYGR